MYNECYKVFIMLGTVNHACNSSMPKAEKQRSWVQDQNERHSNILSQNIKGWECRSVVQVVYYALGFDFYSNHDIKNLRKEMEENIKKLKGILCWWIIRISPVKLFKLFKVIYQEIDDFFFTELEKALPKFIGNHENQIDRVILNNNKQTRGIPTPDFNIYYETRVKWIVFA